MRLGDSILKTILTTDYTKRKLNKLVLFLATLLARFLINTIIALLIYYDKIYIDFVIQKSLSVCIVLKTNIIYEAVRKYEPDILKLSCYFIDNYSPEKFRIWKRNVVLTLCSFLIIYLYCVPITSNLMIAYIVQFLICYFIVDGIENKNGLIIDTYNKIMDRPNVRIYQQSDIIIIDDYVIHKNSQQEEHFEIIETHTTKNHEDDFMILGK